MKPTAIRIGPEDQGRQMSLDEFQDAEFVEGCQFELGRGAIVVTEVPLPGHLKIVDRIRRLIIGYDLKQPGKIVSIASGGECKLPVAQFDSERHPDLAIYLTEPPYQDSSDVWSEWIPELVIEVVSVGSENRDYVEKREEYLAFGVKEYWVVNPERAEILVLRRVRGLWTERTLGSSERYLFRLLPGFELDVASVFGV